MTAIRPVVLSGGGSRGPYGAGVLSALRKHDTEKGLKLSGCYCGTSVGALNACMAAQGDLDALLTLYGFLTTKHVIGENSVDISGFSLWRKSDNSPFNYYANDALRRIVAANANFSRLQASNNHLIICVTNYDTGDLETFYHSDLIPDFIELDKKQPKDKQRLHHYRKIDSQDTLVTTLLASAAIPFFFPPVKIGAHHYVDGGVGNNTATKQAAYFSRFLAESGKGEAADTVCVINDPVRFAIESESRQYQLQAIILRTMDIYQHELVSDYLVTWDRINKNIAHRKKQETDLKAVISSAPYLTPDQRAKLIPEVERILNMTLGGTKQLEMNLLQIRPSTPLEVETLLTFDPARSKNLMKRGAADFLATLKDRGYISALEEEQWGNAL